MIVFLVCALARFTLRSINGYKDFDFGRQYSAVTYQVFIPTGDYVVEKVESTNLDGKTNDNVEGLYISHQYVRYLPTGVLDVYRNINHYHVVGSHLKYLNNQQLDRRIRFIHFDDNEIEEIPTEFFRNSVDLEVISLAKNRIGNLREDTFRGMPKLRWVSLAGNRLRYLPGSLFMGNTNLERISFENNGLTKIGSELVKGLTKLKEVSFDANNCINNGYWYESNIIDELTKEFTINCNGRCDNMNGPQKSMEETHDKVIEMRDRYPKCSNMVDFFSNIVNSASSSSSSESSEDTSYNAHYKNMVPKVCPYSGYPVSQQNPRRN
jgi:Leucine rich repeat